MDYAVLKSPIFCDIHIREGEPLCVITQVREEEMVQSHNSQS